MGTLEGTTALVTGAARRLGRSIALALGRAGADVVVHCRTSGAEAEETAAALRDMGRRAAVIDCDLAREASRKDLIPRACEAIGPIDWLVNNASSFPRDTLFEISGADIARAMEVNTMAPLDLTRALFARNRTGAVVNILDARIGAGYRKHASYLLSKESLASLTRLLALELAPRIRVNAVAPGAVLLPPDVASETLARITRAAPLRHEGRPEDVAAAVCFLLENDAVTGQILFVDGGRHLLGRARGVGR